jgi:hypothetical protein
MRASRVRAKKHAAVSFATVDSESSDDVDDEIDLKTNIVEIIPKKRQDSGPLYRGEHAITAASMAGIKQTRPEADHAFDQANVPGISRLSGVSCCWTAGANLLQVVQKLDTVGDNNSFGQKDSTCGNATVVLARLPADLKGVLDNDPAKNDLTILEYFDKLSDVLVSEKANAKVPFLMAGLKGRLLQKV